jgi:hypothetical protein
LDHSTNHVIRSVSAGGDVRNFLTSFAPVPGNPVIPPAGSLSAQQSLLDIRYQIEQSRRRSLVITTNKYAAALNEHVHERRPACFIVRDANGQALA